MNIDPKVIGNSSIPSSSSPPPIVANGVHAEPHGYMSNDFSFPPGGIPSLRLPVVVVLDAISFFFFLFLVLNEVNLVSGF